MAVKIIINIFTNYTYYNSSQRVIQFVEKRPRKCRGCDVVRLQEGEKTRHRSFNRRHKELG